MMETGYQAIEETMEREQWFKYLKLFCGLLGCTEQIVKQNNGYYVSFCVFLITNLVPNQITVLHK